MFPVEENTLMDPKAGKGSGLSGLGGMDVEGAKGSGAAKAVAAKQKKADQIKKQVLLKKLQAVRQGGGEDIVASHQPEGGILDERLGGKGYKPYTSLTCLLYTSPSPRDRG